MERNMRLLSAVVFGLALCLQASTGRADLVAHWPLNEVSGTVAHDAVGGHDGTVHGEPTWMPFRPQDRGALSFDGRSTYISAPFVLDPAKGPFSVFARVQGTEAGRTLIAQQDASGVGHIWLKATTTGALATDLGVSGLLVGDTTITDGQGHHVGVVWDGRRKHLYVDGTEVAVDPGDMGLLTGSLGGIVIGASKSLEKSSFWSGLMMDVRIYNHALSATEVLELYENPDAGGTLLPRGPQAMVVAPKTLYTGASAAVTITAMQADGSPLAAAVTIRLISAQTTLTVFEGATDRSGRLVAQFDTPDVPLGGYSLEVKVEGVEKPLIVPIQVRQMPIVLIETDKPIYKPGQTIQGRVLVLTNELRPTALDASIQITDGKGVKIFRKELQANAFGVAPFTLDLASELNYGTWKITAESGSARGNVDIRVEEYVLPRFEVKLDMERDYFRVDEQIPGTVRATYFFGKPVDGTVEVRGSRYIGVWEEYARYTAPLSGGSAEFSLPEVRYASGTPGAGGSGSVQLDITVTDTSGHQEKSTKLLKIVSSGVEHQLIASARSFTPGQSYEIILVAQTPDGVPVPVTAELQCYYYSATYQEIWKETRKVSFQGSIPVLLTAPKDAAWVSLQSTARDAAYSPLVRGADEMATAYLTIYASYSPTDSFLHLSRSADKPVRVGQTLAIEVYRTHQATVYYDVFANGHTVWSDATTGSQISFVVTPQMLPAAKVVAYIINPNNEVSADTIEFKVAMDTASHLDVGFSAEQVLPGERVQVQVNAGTESMVGVAIVDESVYALNEGRLNMQEVFNELEKRFLEPQSETHDQPYHYGTRDVFNDAGLQVVTSDGLEAPQGKQALGFWRGGVVFARPATRSGGGEDTGADKSAPLAEVSRIRQFFPETWLWTPDLLTQRDGTATIDLEAPDSITTWRLHAVSTSDAGLGIAESSLRVFQEFFGEPDLPYSVTRGEQFPVRIQIFNYLDQPQVVHVELTESDWFKLLGISTQQVQVNANSVASASFLIQPTKLGRNIMEVTLRSTQRADAVRKEVLVEPQGTKRELVANGLIRAGDTLTADVNMPSYIVSDSGKVLLSITPSLVAQSINGVDDLLQMPYGCGEQNMIFFSPDVEILRYLDATGQLTPEVRAKAEHFITCGYQRELTFRHSDGSFSAFGESDKSGSLWLTAFVLDCFSGARDVTTIDEDILAGAAAWIASHQLTDGSWEPIGFVHHTDMMGGAQGTYALTAFVTIALADYGAAPAAVVQNATKYLRDKLSSVQDDAYALAIAALAFAKVGDSAADTALNRLLELAKSDTDGLHWEPHAIETTAYAALALIEKQRPQANEAVKWISMQRNSMGGYGNTQDTVMALKALMTAARSQSRNVDLTVTAKAPGGSVLAQFTVNQANFDVLQTAELPIGSTIALSATGSGEVRYQVVRRFNVLLGDQSVQKDMSLEVTYDADHVEVDDIVNVNVKVRYSGRKDSTGMMIVDVGVPTGFAVVNESLDALRTKGTITRFEVAGRKVILYLDGLARGEERSFSFQVKARFPVRAVVPDSKAYSYYDPDVRAEASGQEIAVGELEEPK